MLMDIQEQQLYRDFLSDFFDGFNWDYFLETPTTYNFIETLGDAMGRQEGVIFCHGETRAVLIFDGLDWVVKIPTDWNRDYCAQEEFNYQAACDRGLSEMFCPTFKLMCYKNIPIYLMKKVRCAGDYEENDSKIREDLIDKVISHGAQNLSSEEIADDIYEDDSENVVAELLTHYYDECSINAFYLFCGEYNINDIHTGNVGYTDEGMLVVIDFAGF